MRRFVACLLVVFVAGLVGGCGGASGIEPGIPKNVQGPPPDFDPGGSVKPDMTGKAAAKKG